MGQAGTNFQSADLSHYISHPAKCKLLKTALYQYCWYTDVYIIIISNLAFVIWIHIEQIDQGKDDIWCVYNSLVPLVSVQTGQETYQKQTFWKFLKVILTHSK